MYFPPEMEANVNTVKIFCLMNKEDQQFYNNKKNNGINLASISNKITPE